MEKQVCLLSSLAEGYSQSPTSRSAKSTGIWTSLKKMFSHDKPEVLLGKPFLGPVPQENLKTQGFTPFCRIRDVFVWIKPDGDQTDIVFWENGGTWNLLDWGEGSVLKSRLVAEMYFLVTKDDYRIDTDESAVMLAFTNFLQATPDEIASAKVMVYWTLVESVMEDGIITEEEQGTLDKIVAALEISAGEQKILHEKGIETKFQELLDEPLSNEELLSRIEKTVQMARTLKVDQTFIDRLQSSVCPKQK